MAALHIRLQFYWLLNCVGCFLCEDEALHYLFGFGEERVCTMCFCVDCDDAGYSVAEPSLSRPIRSSAADGLPDPDPPPDLPDFPEEESSSSPAASHHPS